MTAPTRILQLIGTMNRAGAETFLMNLYRNLDRNRYQFDFVGFGDEKGDFDAEIEAMGGRVIKLGDGSFTCRLASLDRFLAEHRDYSMVHAHTGLSSAWFLASAMRHGIPHRWLHSHSTTLASGRLAQPYAAVSRAIGGRVATRRLSCGALAASELHGSREPVDLFYNCIDLDSFAPDEKLRARIRADFGIADDEYLAIQVARFEPVKNHDCTLDLASALHPDDRIQILTVGTGAREAWFKAEIERRGLSDRIIHAGLRDDVPDLMRAADGMILPSHHEGFPVVSVEAQAAGLRCIMADVIDPSVDVGLGIVELLPAQDVAKWRALLLEQRDLVVPSFAERRAHLAKMGFDTQIAADRYMKMLKNAGV